MTETITCKCQVVTPMFSSGADQTKCEIRVPEIKAAMRFWWRAANSNLSPDELRKKETLIFGGSGDKEARKSAFTMRVENEMLVNYGQNDWERDAIKVETGKPFKINIFDYLAYGVAVYDKAKKKNILQRTAIGAGSTFDLVIQCDKEYKSEIEEIIRLFSCFGSLGAKSRNGFGKIEIYEINGKAFRTDILELCGGYFGKSEKFPEYTAFSEQSYLFSTKEKYPAWQKALHKIGDFYRLARIGEHYKSGLVVNGVGDHHQGLNRQYLAQPLNMGKDAKGKDIIVNEIGLEDRMAKQFFMIVEPEGDQYRGYILHLPFNIKDVAPKADRKKWLDVNEEMKTQLRKYLEDLMEE